LQGRQTLRSDFPLFCSNEVKGSSFWHREQILLSVISGSWAVVKGGSIRKNALQKNFIKNFSGFAFLEGGRGVGFFYLNRTLSPPSDSSTTPFPGFTHWNLVFTLIYGTLSPSNPQRITLIASRFAVSVYCVSITN
jgi:hypothetical protein